MDTFPSLKVQVLWILLLSGLSYFAIKAIKAKKLVEFPQIKGPLVSLKDIVISYGFYLLLTIGAVPFVFGLLKEVYLKSPIETISLFQLFFMTLVASFLICYVKFRKFSLFDRKENYFEILLKVGLYLLVIFPIVSLIGQLSDTFLYLVFDVKGYEQLAVTFLKKTLSSPIALFGSLMSIVVLAPLTEELLFRGLLFNFIRNRFGSKAGVIFSAILFAIFHYSHSQGLGNISLILSLTFFGAMLAIFYLMTSSLIYPILLHAIFNLLSSLRILFFDV
jgi:uncharacterized protein